MSDFFYGVDGASAITGPLGNPITVGAVSAGQYLLYDGTDIVGSAAPTVWYRSSGQPISTNGLGSFESVLSAPITIPANTLTQDGQVLRLDLSGLGGDTQPYQWRVSLDAGAYGVFDMDDNGDGDARQTAPENWTWEGVVKLIRGASTEFFLHAWFRTSGFYAATPNIIIETFCYGNDSIDWSVANTIDVLFGAHYSTATCSSTIGQLL